MKILEALPSRPLDREALWSHNNQPNSFCAGIISILVDLSAETFLDVCSKREDMRILNASVRQAEVAGCNAGASPSTAQSPQSPRHVLSGRRARWPLRKGCAKQSRCTSACDGNMGWALVQFCG